MLGRAWSFGATQGSAQVPCHPASRARVTLQGVASPASRARVTLQGVASPRRCSPRRGRQRPGRARPRPEPRRTSRRRRAPRLRRIGPPSWHTPTRLTHEGGEHRARPRRGHTQERGGRRRVPAAQRAALRATRGAASSEARILLVEHRHVREEERSTEEGARRAVAHIETIEGGPDGDRPEIGVRRDLHAE